MQHQKQRARFVRAPLHVAAIIVLGGALGACGGGGGGGSDSVELKTKADVSRELGNIDVFLGIVNGITGPSEAAATRGAALKMTSLSRAKGGTQPKAATVEECDSGSYSHEDVDENYTYSYFDSVARATHVYRASYAGCKSEHDGYADTYDGKYEHGYTDEDAQETGYRYIRYGDDSHAYVYTENWTDDSGSPYKSEYRGTVQARLTNAGYDSRAKDFDFRYSEHSGYSAHVVIGDGDPIRIGIDESGTALAGTVSYETSECAGGTLSYATLTPLTSSDNVTQGKLKLTSGKDSATITFEADGSASIEFGNGSSASLNADELQAAFDDQPC